MESILLGAKVLQFLSGIFKIFFKAKKQIMLGGYYIAFFRSSRSDKKFNIELSYISINGDCVRWKFLHYSRIEDKQLKLFGSGVGYISDNKDIAVSYCSDDRMEQVGSFLLRYDSNICREVFMKGYYVGFMKDEPERTFQMPYVTVRIEGLSKWEETKYLWSFLYKKPYFKDFEKAVEFVENKYSTTFHDVIDSYRLQFPKSSSTSQEETPCKNSLLP